MILDPESSAEKAKVARAAAVEAARVAAEALAAAEAAENEAARATAASSMRPDGAASEPTGIAREIAAGYAFDGAALELGSVVFDGTADPGARIRIPLATLNRHGLVAGATGTGKTKTLQGIAEQLSAAGVPVVMADVKGDLSGLSAPGIDNEKIRDRAAATGETDWQPTGYPVEFLSLGTDGIGIPVRATITAFGPILLSKVLGLNKTQESTLGLVFHWADSNGLALLDLKDLRAVIAHLTSDEGKADLKGIGGVSTATAGVILRALVNLEADGGDTFFGEPELETEDLLRLDGAGRGVISLFELGSQAARPAMFSTFLMWVLADLFQTLPEVGDVDKPKLVFVFDEAHLLFADASKAFLEQVEQTVKLIRSKGVGVIFCTQLPTDLPKEVLSQLGARIQHALRFLCDAKPARRAGQCFKPARQSGSTRAARLHTRRRTSSEQNGAYVSHYRCLRPEEGTDLAGDRRSNRDCPRRERCPDSSGLDQNSAPAIADGYRRRRRDSRGRRVEHIGLAVPHHCRSRVCLRETDGPTRDRAERGREVRYPPATARGAIGRGADHGQSSGGEFSEICGLRCGTRDFAEHFRDGPPPP